MKITKNGLPDLIPVRMLNEFAYCPRLFYMEYVQGEFEESADTLSGSFAHRRVNEEKGKLPEPSEMEKESPEIHAKSVMLSAPMLGIIAKMDIIESKNGMVIPVDYKRGQKPDTVEGAWEPERIQVCAQGLILRENGYKCDRGEIYYVASKEAVQIPLDEKLIERTKSLLSELRNVAAAGAVPAPLEESKKCPRCSLVGICLPDELNMLTASEGEDKSSKPVRRLIPTNDDALPMYVQEQGSTVGKIGDELRISSKKVVLKSVRIMDVSQLILLGNAQATEQTLRELCYRGIPICHMSYGGWFYGITTGMTHKNVELRQKQFSVAGNSNASLELAKKFVESKIINCRTILRRNYKDIPGSALKRLADLADEALKARNSGELLGIEGTAARVYFMHFKGMLKPESARKLAFDFNERNRRPPRDPINALLSFVYSMMAKDFTVTLLSVGFDPYMGFYHVPKYGRPALSLDMMEEFRPIIGDSVVIGLLNNEQIKEEDFIKRAGSCALTDKARKEVILAYEKRLDSLIRHPIFKYEISYRRVLEVQARLLGRVLTGEIDGYTAFTTR